MAPIPIALCGRHPGMATDFRSLMMPEYDVVHHFPSTEAAHNELPSVLAGQSTQAHSRIGSNAEATGAQIPKAIVVGRGFSREDSDEMRTIPGAKQVPWLYPDMAKIPAQGPPNIASIAERAKTALRENGLVQGNETNVKPAEWGF